MHWYLGVLRKYAVFSGRARRKEYWMFVLFNVLIAFVLGLVEGMTGIAPESEESVLVMLYFLAVLLPGLAVGVRRLHDTGRSGWNMLLFLIPIIGEFVLLAFMCADSERGTNRYGPSPKMPDEEDWLDPASQPPPPPLRLDGWVGGAVRQCPACGLGNPARATRCSECRASLSGTVPFTPSASAYQEA
jgi:uncharacterized membrane protein YhaH (DUF805 family)